MDQIRLQNYRCFEDSGSISLKPITFLLGANSTGKSSFLKFFPLLKQSLSIKRKGTFLWYSTDVDFKDFKNTVKDEKGSISIEFSFHLDNQRFNRFYWEEDETIRGKKVLVNVEIKISGKGQTGNFDYLSEVKLSFLDQNICINVDEDNTTLININGRNVEQDFKTYDINNAMQLIGRIVEKHDDHFFFGGPTSAYEYFLNLTRKNKKEEDRRLFMIEHSFCLMDKTSTCEKLLKIGLNDNDVDLMNDMYLLLNVNHIIEEVNNYLYDYSCNVSYVQPLRVVAERYYRYQNYAIDEIESDGKNMAMYFANLKDSELIKFQNWTSRLFGFEVYVVPHEGHVELQIAEGDKPQRNLVDLGFGYTQLLPIITVIWNAVKKKNTKGFPKGRNSNVPITIAIEQPELHLHPRLQMKFASMLVQVIKNEQYNNVKFLIETHSETIIDKIGELVEEDPSLRNDVNVLLFNAIHEGMEKYVESVEYDQYGVLQKWPIGFFEEELC